MAPKSLAEQIAELEDLTPRDFDPEDIDRGIQSSDDEASVKDDSAGREHYQAVGKAKLRKEDPISLGKQYAGSRVSRDALEAESDDDPFKARSSDEEGSQDEIEEDGADEDEEDVSEESEEEQRGKRKSSKGRLEVEFDDMDTDGSEDSEDSMEDFDEDESDEDEDGLSDEDEEEEEEEEKPTKRRVKFDDSAKSTSDDREQLRQLMATDQKTIAATISQAAKADATKGKAVKQQRATFDALLNTRIKLQKGLTAINQLSVAMAAQETPDKPAAAANGEAIKSAETAALTLWSTLEELRLALADAQTQDESKKRKRPTPASTTTTSLWKRMADLESDAVTHRRTILDKWSLKVRSSNATSLASTSRGKLLGSSATTQQTITAVLDAHIAQETDDSNRAAKRARKDAHAHTATEPLIYDDTVFYQSLLRDLVEQRMSSSEAITNGLDTLHLLPSRSVHPVTGMRKDKVKKEVDARASKGRKMRFDVHEKLQNFMAPEDRGSWTVHAREEFFASLLGKTASGLLREEEEGDDDEVNGVNVDGVESDEDLEEGGLKLFRS